MVKPNSSFQDAYRLLHEGSIALSDMETNGVRINHEYLTQTIQATEEKAKDLEISMRKDSLWRTWHKHFGGRTNLESSHQLSHILYNVLGYEVKAYTEKTKDLSEEQRRPSVDTEALEDIDHPFVRNLQKLLNLKKTLGTYLYGIGREMVFYDGFYWVHPIYNLHTASTYRSSCNNPNFQNVPKRNPEMARLIRPCYLPHPGHHIVEFDFAQLEVRVAGCYTKDPVLMRYIKDKKTDMHRDAAQKIFCLSSKEYEELNKNDYFKKTIRDSAKNEFVFPQFYGSNHVNCAKNIWRSIKKRNFCVGPEGKSFYKHLAKHGIQDRGACEHGQDPEKNSFEAHVKEVEEWMWHEQYQVYTQWKREWWNKYQRNGGFKMLTGFEINGLFKRNDVINYPIQGSAFHCLLWCIVVINKWLKKNKMKSRIIGEIHDSLIMSVHPKELQEVLSFCHYVMTVELPKHYPWIIVPMEAEAEVAPVDHDWLKIKTWESKDGKWSLKA